MFGYIMPEKPEMKIKEYELFRAYYCGLCKSIGSRHGLFKRLSLNYDTTFLAILLSSVAEIDIDVVKKRCLVHPAKKRYIIVENDIIGYASDINMLLAYYNLENDWKDERSVLSGTGMLMLKQNCRKLKRKYPEKCGIIEKRLNELLTLEKEKCNSMDKAAEPFSRLMEEVVAYEPLCRDGKREKALRWIGYNLGKWIYIIDAFDDLEEDIKKHLYNPLVYQYNHCDESAGDFRKRIKERVEFNLTHALSQIAKAYELLEIKGNSGVLENIIYMGMLRKTEQIIKTGSCEEVEKSI